MPFMYCQTHTCAIQDVGLTWREAYLTGCQCCGEVPLAITDPSVVEVTQHLLIEIDELREEIEELKSHKQP